MNCLSEKNTLKRVLLLVFACLLFNASLYLYEDKAYAEENTNSTTNATTNFATEPSSNTNSNIVNIPDENFKILLNETLGNTELTADITKQELESITELEIGDEDEILDYTGIEYCSGLDRLVFLGNVADRLKISDDNVEILRNGELNITYLKLWYVDCTDYSFLSNMTNLKTIEMASCNIESLPDLTKISGLTTLCINCDMLTDISGISGLKKLRFVDFSSCSISDIYSLKNMTSIILLDLSWVDITEKNEARNIATIGSLINIEHLQLLGCGISDTHTSMFNKLTKLISLDIEYNHIADFSFISNLPKLQSLMGDDTKTNMDYYYESFGDTKSYVIKNDVKDENGEYVEPKRASYYTYNSDTREITIDLENCPSEFVIEYKFEITTKDGETELIRHHKNVNISTREIILDDVYFLNDTITLSTNVEGDNFKYQWYKDGVAISGAMAPTYVIDCATTSDMGKYSVVIRNEDMISTSPEVTPNIKPYERMKASLEIDSKPNNENFFARIDDITFRFNVEGGSGEYTYTLYYRKDSVWSNSIATTTEEIYKKKMYSAGEYNFHIDVKDSDGNEATSDEVSMTIYDKIAGNIEMTGASESMPAVEGDILTLSAKDVEGGSGEGYTYKFFVENVENGGSFLIQDFSENATVKAKVSTASTRKYTLYVKDSLGNIAETDTITIDIVKHLFTADNSIEDIYRYYDEPISLQVRSTPNDTFTYKYAYIDMNTGEEHVLLDYSNKTSYECSFNDTGKKELIVYAKDSSGNVVKINSVVVGVCEKPLSVKVEIPGYKEGMTVYKTESIPCKVTVDGGSGKMVAYGVASEYSYSKCGWPVDGPEFIEASDIDREYIVIIVYDSYGNRAVSETFYFNVLDCEKLNDALTVDGATQIDVLGEKRLIALKGNDLTLNFTATDKYGTDEYKYQYVVRNAVTGAEVLIKDYSTSTSVVAKISSVSVRKYIVYVQDSSGEIVAVDNIVVYIYDTPLEATFCVNGNVADISEIKVYKDVPVTLSVKATGGTGEYKYGFLIVNSVDRNIVDLWDSREATYTWTPDFYSYYKSNDYKIYMAVECADGQFLISGDPNEGKDYIPIHVYKPEVTLDIDGVKEFGTDLVAFMGDKITLNASVESADENYTYKYVVENVANGQIATIKDFSTSVSVDKTLYMASSLNSYVQKFTVYAKDKYGNVYESDPVIINAYKKATVTAKASVDVVVKGGEVTLSGKATGGYGDYTYSYIVYNKDTKKWARLADNITSSTFTWNAISAGNRVFYVDVKDATGNIVRSKAINVNVKEALSVKAVTTAKEVVSGDKVTITATAIGGSGEYTYSYIVYNKDTKKWARLADNITSNTYTWKAGNIGNRVFYVDVKDSTGKVVRSKAISISVVDELDEMYTLVEVIKGDMSVGDSATFKAYTIGGSGVYTYSFIVYNKDTKKWARLADNITSNTYTWKAKTAGNRLFYVDVMDSKGTVERIGDIPINVK